MKDWQIITITIILIIVIFTMFVFWFIKEQTTSYYNFKIEITELIEDIDLTDYQVEKLDCKMELFSRSEYSNGEFGKLYTVYIFERYLKETDYDFWYEIKTIFEE